MSLLANRPGESCAFVVFGASGDLTQRKLVPALHSLACEELLPEQTQLVGVARTQYAQDELVEHYYQGVETYARLKPGLCERWGEFAKRISYVAGNYDDPETYRRLGEHLEQFDRAAGTEGNRLFYLAVPPPLYPTIVEQIGRAGLQNQGTGWSRIIIEKPFGRDLESAKQLNEQVHAVFGEDQVYRIDHYLGKETVQNIFIFRFGNSIWEPLWSRNYIDHVQITMAETVGVEHRGPYYDRAGVLRDIFQNHLLQLLSLIAMEPPYTFSAKALRDEKVKVLQAIRPIRLEDGVWGRYEGYHQEPGVDPQSKTPTYIALKLLVDNWRWQGVPFYIRAGKRLAAKVTEITLQFKPVPHFLLDENVDMPPNQLALMIQPDEGIHLSFQTKLPGWGMRAKQVDMDFHYARQFGPEGLPDAYERLLLDAMQGDASLFTRSDEIELSWQIVNPLLVQVEPVIYAQGSQGPSVADTLMARDGRQWRPIASSQTGPENGED